MGHEMLTMRAFFCIDSTAIRDASSGSMEGW